MSEAHSLFERLNMGSPVYLPPIHPRNRLEDLVLASIFNSEPPQYLVKAPSTLGEIPWAIRTKTRGVRVRSGNVHQAMSRDSQVRAKYLKDITTTDGKPRMDRLFSSIATYKVVTETKEETEAVIRSHQTEDNVLLALNKKLVKGTTLRRVLRLVNPAFPWLVSAPDAVVFQDGEVVGLVEIKSTRGNCYCDFGGKMIRKGKNGLELIPGSKTWYQIQASLAVSNLEWCLLHSENPERGESVTVFVHRDEEAIAHMLLNLHSYFVNDFLPAITAK